MAKEFYEMRLHICKFSLLINASVQKFQNFEIMHVSRMHLLLMFPYANQSEYIYDINHISRDIYCITILLEHNLSHFYTQSILKNLMSPNESQKLSGFIKGKLMVDEKLNYSGTHQMFWARIFIYQKQHCH